MNLSFEQFAELARRFNLIPLFDELPADLDTPVSAFLKLATGDSDFLFESVLGGEKWGRYSFLGTRPKRIFSLRDDRLTAVDPETGRSESFAHGGDPLGVFRKILSGFKPYQDPGLPRFFGGLVGYLAYDMVRYFGKIAVSKPKPYAAPDLCFLLTDTAVIFDNLGQVMKVVCCVEIPADADATALRAIYDAAVSRVGAAKTALSKPLPPPVSLEKGGEAPVVMSLAKETFCERVAAAQEYIKAGDVFQVVLSNRFERDAAGLDPFSVYRRLRRINPSPYMFFLRLRELTVVGASPEILVRLEDGRVEVRPIAGTRRRGAAEEEDAALEKELRADPKEQAEHIMLVDLGRNDVGRVAEIGTVRVDEERAVERYSHVMHLVSHVSGRLAAGKDVFDVIAAAFPAGTLTGAPKIRAMQVIDELEDSARGVYGGAIGYVSFTGNTDLAIAIRTAVFRDGKVFVQAGAGVVDNSVPESEFQECQNKANGVLTALIPGQGT